MKEKMMQIYVQSCGVSPNHDYIWLQNDNQKIQPPLLYLIDTLREKNAPSVVIGRYGQELTLLIFGLKTSRGVDFRGRPILNSLVWIGETDEEPFLRMLAARSLQREEYFLKAIDEAVIGCDDNPGFKVLWDKIEELTRREKADEQLPDNTRKIGKNCQKLRYELAEELRECCLPEQEGALVVVTGVVEGETLRKAGVWRSLSRLLDSESWEEISKEKDLGIVNTSEVLQFFYKASLLLNKDIFLLALAIIVALSVILYPLPTNHQP